MTHTDEVVEIERFVLWYIENHDDGFTTSIFGQVEAFRSRLVEFIATAQSAEVNEAYNQGVHDMRMYIEEQILHEIALGSANSNKSRIEDYDLLIEYARSLRKPTSPTPAEVTSE